MLHHSIASTCFRPWWRSNVQTWTRRTCNRSVSWKLSRKCRTSLSSSPPSRSTGPSTATRWRSRMFWIRPERGSKWLLGSSTSLTMTPTDLAILAAMTTSCSQMHQTPEIELKPRHSFKDMKLAFTTALSWKWLNRAFNASKLWFLLVSVKTLILNHFSRNLLHI